MLRLTPADMFTSSTEADDDDADADYELKGLNAIGPLMLMGMENQQGNHHPCCSDTS